VFHRRRPDIYTAAKAITFYRESAKITGGKI